MKVIITTLFAVCMATALTLSHANDTDRPHRFNTEVYECGDLNTALANISGGLFSCVRLSDEAVNFSTCIQQAANAYFFAKFNACLCEAEVFNKRDISKAKCFVEAKAAAHAYFELIKVDEPLDLDALTFDMMQGGQ